MKIKFGLVALSATATLMLAGTTSVDAKGPETEVKKQPEVVKVKIGDTLSSIAESHSTTFVQLFNANSSIVDPNVLDVDNEVTIPLPDAQLPDRYSAYIASSAPAAVMQTSAAIPAGTYSQTTTQSGVSYSQGSVAGNGYTWGNCTWYVKNRRSDLPNNLGNGGSWSGSATAQGYQTGSAARAGAVAEQAGHVAYVESVNGNGTVTVSEMNYGGGLGQVHTRTVPSGQFRYIY